MQALPLLVVELPTPDGHEDAWNKWYQDVHMPDLLATVDGAVRSIRYQVTHGDDTYRYVVAHQFASVEHLHRYADSPLIADRSSEYGRLWGIPTNWRRRVLTPIVEIP
jgi:hypothetical protein